MCALGDRLRKEAAEAQQRFDDELARKAAQEMLGAQQLHELECASDVVVRSLYGAIETNYLRTGLLGHTHTHVHAVCTNTATRMTAVDACTCALSHALEAPSTAPDIGCIRGAAGRQGSRAAPTDGGPTLRHAGCAGTRRACGAQIRCLCATVCNELSHPSLPPACYLSRLTTK